MTIIDLLPALLALAAAIERVIELLKPTLGTIADRLKLSDDAQGVVTRIVSIVLGIVAVVGMGDSFNLLALSPVYSNVSPLFGLIVTGVIVGGGSNALHVVYEILTANKEQPAPQG